MIDAEEGLTRREFLGAAVSAPGGSRRRGVSRRPASPRGVQYCQGDSPVRRTHETGREVDLSAETASAPSQHPVRAITLDPNAINVLTAGLATLGHDLQPFVLNHMFLWAQAQEAGTHPLRWQIAAPQAGTYEVSVLIAAPGSDVEITCGTDTRRRHIPDAGWNRCLIDDLSLPQGVSELAVTIRSRGPVKLSSVELVQPDIKAHLQTEAEDQRRQPEWFSRAGYGVMFQWTNRATPRRGGIKPWSQKVQEFDVEAFVDRVADMGAAYVLWSVTWGQQFISAPIQALDDLVPARTTARDLLGELATGLEHRGINPLFYYHYGYDCYHAKDEEWMRAAGGYDADKTALFKNVQSIVGEIGTQDPESA